MKSLNDLKIGMRLNIILSAVIVVLFGTFGWYTITSQTKAVNENADTRLFEQVDDLVEMIDMQVHDNQKNVITMGEASYELLISCNKVGISGTTENVELINQVDNSTQEAALPVLTLNGTPLIGDNSFVDMIGSKSGATNTIFQRFENGYVRLSTNIKKTMERGL